MADDGQIIILALENAGQPLRPFHILDFCNNPDLGQLRGDNFTALACIGWRRQAQRHVNRQGHARLLQKRFGLFRVIGVGTGQVDIAGVNGHVMAADWCAKAILRALNNCFAVNGIGDCAAHPHVVKRLALVVDCNQRFALRATLGDGKARIILKLRHGLEGTKARKRIDIPCQQCGDLRRRVVDNAERHFFEGNRGWCAIIVPFHQGQR